VTIFGYNTKVVTFGRQEVAIFDDTLSFCKPSQLKSAIHYLSANHHSLKAPYIIIKWSRVLEVPACHALPSWLCKDSDCYHQYPRFKESQMYYENSRICSQSISYKKLISRQVRIFNHAIVTKACRCNDEKQCKICAFSNTS